MNTNSVRDILPVHEHPPVNAVRGIFHAARMQMLGLKEKFKDSNDKARYIRFNLTPEQLYIYEWIGYIFVILALPHEVFARQIGCSTQTLRQWLRQSGHFPNKPNFRRLIDIYRTNFLDQLAVELLHGSKIGQWREFKRHLTKKELNEKLNAKYGEII